MKKLFTMLLFAFVFAATVFTGCGACDSGTVEDNNGTTTGSDTNSPRSYAGSVMDDTVNDLDNAFTGGNAGSGSGSNGGAGSNSGSGANGGSASNSGSGANGGTGGSAAGSSSSASSH